VLVNNAGAIGDILPPGDPRKGDIELLEPIPSEMAELVEFLMTRPSGSLYRNITVFPDCEWVY